MAKINRLDILRRLVAHCGYRSYLEIGVAGGSTFRALEVERKVGVDPDWRLWYLLRREVKKVTSDRFFARNRERFDLVFIDGLHVAAQTWRDLENALAVLNPGGTVLLHDCLPASREQQQVPRGDQVAWTGDVWRAFLKASQQPDLHTFLCDTDRGCGVVRREPRPAGVPVAPGGFDALAVQGVSWEEFDAHKHEWLRIVPPEGIFAVLDALDPGGRR